MTERRALTACARDYEQLFEENDGRVVGPPYRAFNGRHGEGATSGGGRPLFLEGGDRYFLEGAAHHDFFNKLLAHPTAQRDESPDQTIDAVHVLRLDSGS